MTLPIGSYNYFYAIVNNHLQVKHIQSFKTEVGAAADMWGNGDSQEGVRNICYTVAVVTTMTDDHSNDSEYETAHNVDVVTSGSGSSNSQLVCTASMSDAIANVAFATEIIDHFASNAMGYQNAIIYEDVQDWSRFGFRKLKASCLPIPKKKLQWIGLQDSYLAADTSTWSDADYAGLIKLDGENYYKSIYAALNHDHKLYALKLMKPFFV